MIPPPAMTTSALSMPEHAPELEDQLQSGKGRDVSVIEWRRHLDHIESHQFRARCGHAKKVDGLPSGEPARGWDLGPGCEGGVQGVDVERNVQALAGDRLGDYAGCARVTDQLRGGNERHAASADELELFGVIVPPAAARHACRRDG